MFERMRCKYIINNIGAQRNTTVEIADDVDARQGEAIDPDEVWMLACAATQIDRHRVICRYRLMRVMPLLAPRGPSGLRVLQARFHLELSSAADTSRKPIRSQPGSSNRAWQMGC